MDASHPPNRNFLAVHADENSAVFRGLASPVRLRILRLLHRLGPRNVNEISDSLGLPQSTVATNIQVLESSGLIRTETTKATKGQQKLCIARFDEIILRFDDYDPRRDDKIIEVAMPLGLYTSCSVSAPCGLCSTDGIIGLLDMPDYLLDPNRMRAGLIWFERGHVEYKFPNNAKILGAEIEALEVAMELSSEVPGTNTDWPSDISVWINDVKIGTWTSPGDYGDKRGIYTPRWWKLEGSQYGELKTWRVAPGGSQIDGKRVSDITIDQLGLANHHSIRLRIGIDERAEHPGGINIFGKGFGNHDQDIVLRLHLKEATGKANGEGAGEEIRRERPAVRANGRKKAAALG